MPTILLFITCIAYAILLQGIKEVWKNRKRSDTYEREGFNNAMVEVVIMLTWIICYYVAR